jgi:hypothetical protein
MNLNEVVHSVNATLILTPEPAYMIGYNYPSLLCTFFNTECTHIRDLKRNFLFNVPPRYLIAIFHGKEWLRSSSSGGGLL